MKKTMQMMKTLMPAIALIAFAGGCGEKKEDSKSSASEGAKPVPVSRAQDKEYAKALDEQLAMKRKLLSESAAAFKELNEARKADPEGKSERFIAAKKAYDEMVEKVKAFHEDARAFVAGRIQREISNGLNIKQNTNTKGNK